MHLKRNKIPKTWAVPRKGTKYVVRPLNNLKNSVPLLIILRDMLKVARTRKEVKKLLNLGKIKVNGKVVKEEKYALTLFDVLKLGEKNLRVVFKGKKFAEADSGIIIPDLVLMSK